jgi:hypothetical protein
MPCGGMPGGGGIMPCGGGIMPCGSMPGIVEYVGGGGGPRYMFAW